MLNASNDATEEAWKSVVLDASALLVLLSVLVFLSVKGFLAALHPASIEARHQTVRRTDEYM
jgi:hypothetical protein